jgi:tetratricopeptide (TPR) repeat protein
LANSTDLVRRIAIDQKKREKLEESIGSIGTLFNPTERSTKNLENENGDFIWFQLFIESLLRMSDYALHPSQKEFIRLVRHKYHNDIAKLRIIDELESSYQANQAIRWYTRDSFLYVILNKALREQDYFILTILRFFLRDLFHALIELKKFDEPVIKLYRGQVLDIEELNTLINNQNKFISMNSLLSTSRDQLVARCFAESSMDPSNTRLRTVLFEIEANTSRTDSKPFADITSSSYYSDKEGEILFMAGSIFRIVDVQKVSEIDPIWSVKMVLCGEKDNQLNEVFTNLKSHLSNKTDMFSVGKILYDMDKGEQAKHVFELFDEHLRIKNGDLFDNPIEPYTPGKYYPEIIQEAQELIAKITENNGDREELASYYLILGTTYKDLEQYDSALVNFQKSLNVLLDLHGQDHLSVAMGHELIGQTYEKQENFQLAITSWKECLRIRQQLLPQGHPNIAETFCNIGDLYNAIDDFDRALAMYEEALKIQLISLPSNHPSTAQTYVNIGWVYEQTNQFHLALKNYTTAFKILSVSRSPDDTSLLQIQEDIDKMRMVLGIHLDDHFH